MVARVAESAESLPFRAVLDARCQRGLHWRYTVEGPVPPDIHDDTQSSLHNRIVAESRIVHSREAWGQHVLHRYVLPFRFELRIWTRPGELSFIHRQTASAEQRDLDRAAFEALLTTWCRERTSSKY